MTHDRPCANVRNYGAVGDAQTPDTRAIQSAIDACRQAGGGTVYIPAGDYLVGSLFLTSHLTLHLDAGARLLGSQDAADYPIVDGRWEGIDRKTHAPLIAGDDLTNVTLTGRGTIDGRGAGWWQQHRAGTLNYPRPRLIGLTSCDNVTIEGITLTRSPSWTIHPARCHNVTVDKVTILNPPDSPNTDGINPDACRNVHISNCHIDVGDDCITLKSGTEEDRAALSPCENIAITNCTMVHGHGGVVIGSEMSGGVRNVVIANCVFVGTDRGIRLKSRRGRGGVVEDIRVSNVLMEDVLCPFIMNLYYGCGAWGAERISDKRPYPVDEGTPRFRRIQFNGITARRVRYAAGFIYGLAEMPIEEISFSDIAISMAPDAEPGHPAMAPDMEPMQRAGFYAWNASSLRFHHVEVEGQLGPAFALTHVTGVEINGCGTRTLDPGTRGSGAPGSGAPVLRLENVQEAFVHGCVARTGDVFCLVEGEANRNISFAANDLSRTRQAVRLGTTASSQAIIGL
jgi:polygalacturonase